MNTNFSSTAQPTLKLGFIGGGVSAAIGPTHFFASRLDGRWQLVSGCFSRDYEISLRTAKRWGVSKDRVYPSWEDFIEGEKNQIDAAIVLAPTPDHMKIILGLLSSDIPVICEKPLVASHAEAKLIYEKLISTSGFVAITYNYSGYVMIRELRARIQAGEFGRLIKLQFEMPQEGFVRVDPETGELIKPQEWRLIDGSIPTICHDLGAHLHHLSHFLTDKKIHKTAAVFSSHSPHGGVVDDVMAWLEYDDGMMGSFWMSKSALGHRNGLKIRVYGTDASAEWFQSEPEEMRLSYKNGTRTIMDRASSGLVSLHPRYNRYRAGHPSGFIEAFANLYSDIADALCLYKEIGKLDNQYVFGVEHSLRELELFAAIAEANETKQWVHVDPPNDKRT